MYGKMQECELTEIIPLTGTSADLCFLTLSLLTVHLCKGGCSDFLGGVRGKEPTCLCRRLKRFGFDPWVRKIPQRRAW